MTYVPVVYSPYLGEQLAVPLPRYAQIVNYSEAAFFGVHRNNQDEYACRTIWTHYQRQAVSRALKAAQDEFWKYCGYPMVSTFITGERHDYNPRTVLLDNCHIIGLGSMTISFIHNAYHVDHTTDPATVVMPMCLSDNDHWHIYHPGTDIEIYPSGFDQYTTWDPNPPPIGTYTCWTRFYIPRVRMVKTADEINPDSGWDYNDLNHFEDNVDIKMISPNFNYAVNVFGKPYCSSSPTLDNYWNDAEIHNKDISQIHMGRSPSGYGCGDFHPIFMDINYVCGLEKLDPHAEDAIIRLAHSRMPSEPCGCDFLRTMWDRDKHVPDVLTAERENCPLGMSDGAWLAWCFLQNMICYRAGAL